MWAKTARIPEYITNNKGPNNGLGMRVTKIKEDTSCMTDTCFMHRLALYRLFQWPSLNLHRMQSILYCSTACDQLGRL